VRNNVRPLGGFTSARSQRIRHSVVDRTGNRKKFLRAAVGGRNTPSLPGSVTVETVEISRPFTGEQFSAVAAHRPAEPQRRAD